MTTKSSGAITHDLKPEQMTPEERDQLAIDWIQDNAPDHVLQHLDQEANKAHLYIVSLEKGLDDLEKHVERLKAERDALRAQLAAAGRIFAHFGGLGELMQWENADGESAEYVVNAFLDAYIGEVNE